MKAFAAVILAIIVAAAGHGTAAAQELVGDAGGSIGPDLAVPITSAVAVQMLQGRAAAMIEAVSHEHSHGTIAA